MIGLIQRVSEASVRIKGALDGAAVNGAVHGAVVGAIGPGLLVLVCAEQGDTEAQADKFLAKLLKLRIFSDAQGKMNHSVQDLDGQGTVGGLLLVSQFTLAANVQGGNRPSFTQAAAPAEGRRLYDYLVAQARLAHPQVQTGQFAADMKVALVNDGPVTIPMRIAPKIVPAMTPAIDPVSMDS